MEEDPRAAAPVIGDLVEPTPVTLPDGTTVLVDDLGRVVVPTSPSAWDIFWRDPGGEISGATGKVFTSVGSTVGSAVGGAAGGVVAGTADSVVERLGGWLWIGLAIAAAVVVLRR